MKYIVFAILALFTTGAFAAKDDGIELEGLKWVDEGYLERQRNLIDEMGRGEFGTRLHQDKSDLRLLQRIIDKELINQTETQKQQALGVVLGDIFINELNMEWKVYLDRYGKSRAICLKETHHCLFPITMISKRARLGVKADIQKLYDDGVSYLEDYLPKLPYAVPKKSNPE